MHYLCKCHLSTQTHTQIFIITSMIHSSLLTILWSTIQFHRIYSRQYKKLHYPKQQSIIPALASTKSNHVILSDVRSTFGMWLWNVSIFLYYPFYENGLPIEWDVEILFIFKCMKSCHMRFDSITSILICCFPSLPSIIQKSSRRIKASTNESVLLIYYLRFCKALRFRLTFLECIKASTSFDMICLWAFTLLF